MDVNIVDWKYGVPQNPEYDSAKFVFSAKLLNTRAYDSCVSGSTKDNEEDAKLKVQNILEWVNNNEHKLKKHMGNHDVYSEWFVQPLVAEKEWFAERLDNIEQTIKTYNKAKFLEALCLVSLSINEDDSFEVEYGAPDDADDLDDIMGGHGPYVEITSNFEMGNIGGSG